MHTRNTHDDDLKDVSSRNKTSYKCNVNRLYYNCCMNFPPTILLRVEILKYNSEIIDELRSELRSMSNGGYIAECHIISSQHPIELRYFLCTSWTVFCLGSNLNVPTTRWG